MSERCGAECLFNERTFYFIQHGHIKEKNTTAGTATLNTSYELRTN